MNTTSEASRSSRHGDPPAGTPVDGVLFPIA
jgi:hypothetical protein